MKSILFTALILISSLSHSKAYLEASRTECFSPCPVVFSGVKTEGPEHIKFKEYGYFFDFGDDSLAVHSVTGLPSNEQAGGPVASHTFICEEGICKFNVLLKVFFQDDTESADTLEVTVYSPQAYFSASDTICVSTSGNFEGCPNGASESTTMPPLNGYNRKRVLLKRGDKFPKSCIQYGQHNVLIEPFGDPSLPRPEFLEAVSIGVSSHCGKKDPNSDAEIARYGNPWISNITVTGIRTPFINYGMSFAHLSAHDIDMDYYNQDFGGQFTITSIGNWCEKTEKISCSKVPYPLGAYLSNVKIIGSENSYPGLNINGLNCPLTSWVGIQNVKAFNSWSHNFRMEGFRFMSISHSDFRGHHHNKGNKVAITARTCGYSMDDPLELEYRKDKEDNDPASRYIVVADTHMGSSDSTHSTWRLHLGPTNSEVAETVIDGIVERVTFTKPAASDAPHMGLNGLWLTARDNKYDEGVQQCIVMNPGANPVHGEIDCNGNIPVIEARNGCER